MKTIFNEKMSYFQNYDCNNHGVYIRIYKLDTN